MVYAFKHCLAPFNTLQILFYSSLPNSQPYVLIFLLGFNTAKGDLVRSILYPKPVNYKLYRDALVFLCSLIGLSMIGMVYAVCVFALDGVRHQYYN